MATLDEILKRELNPFDPITFKTGNFWTSDNQESIVTVDSIHANVLEEITEMVSRVAKDHITRGILLKGGRGSGKSYLLKRLKKQLNAKAFFVYIEPCPDNNYLWRHTLRYTVDSLMQVPDGQEESQLLLWLKSLSVFKKRGLLEILLGQKALFVKELIKKYPTGIYQGKEFFGVLYELMKAENFSDACDWLKGDSLSEEDLKNLGVKTVIDNEVAARNILANFGTIADSTYPIVLCFDQVELSPKLPAGRFDISSAFKLNTALHNASLKNFVVIISIIRDIFHKNKTVIPQADLDRIELETELREINFKQVQALWETRLYPLHRQVTAKPESSIAPLTTSDLENEYPSGKANLRDSLILGGKLYEKYKNGLIEGREKLSETTIISPPPKSAGPEEFKLLWLVQFKKTQEKVSKINQFSAIELIDMLKKVLAALKIEILKHKLLPSPTYAGYSFSYRCPKSENAVGIFWNESPNMQSLYYAMNACQKALGAGLCDFLMLLRQEDFASLKGKAYSNYMQIFQAEDNPNNHHIKVDTESLHYLRTYQLLANEARSGDLVLSNQVIALEKLEELVHETEVLKECRLLQELKIFAPLPLIEPPIPIYTKCIKNFIKVHHLMSWKTLVENIKQQFPEIEEEQLDLIISELRAEPHPFITILDPGVSKNEQLVCLNP